MKNIQTLKPFHKGTVKVVTEIQCSESPSNEYKSQLLSGTHKHTHTLTYTVPSISYCTYILKNCKPFYSYWSADFLKLNCLVSLCSWYAIDFLWNALRKKIWQSCRTKRRSQFYLVDNLIMQQLTTTFLFLSPAFLGELLLK